MLHRWRLLVGLISVFGLVVTMIGSGALTASAGAGLITQGIGHIPAYICHANNSDTNQYVSNAPDISSIVKGEGHDSHNGPLWNPTLKDNKIDWGDIIPPFTYTPGDYPNQIYNGAYPGQNWTTGGQAIYENNCNVPENYWNATVTTTIKSGATVLTSGTTQLVTPKAGVSVYDNATVSHLDTGIEPTGKVTYSFFTKGDCTGSHTDSEVGLSGGSADPSSTQGPLGAGSYSYHAVYEGDSKYHGSTSACEPLTVAKADPSIRTEQTPISDKVGATLKDTAFVTGFNPKETVTFVLTNSGGTAVFTSDPITLDSTGKATMVTGYVANTADTYYWVATYKGDINNNSVSSGATDEKVIISSNELVPTIVTTPNPKKTTVGATLKDTATIGGIANPNGYIIFTLKAPNGTDVWTKRVDITANGSYSTGTGFVANVQGTWKWIAKYYDADGKFIVGSGENDELVTVDPAGGVLAQTAMTLPAQGLAVGLLAFGLLAMAGALAWRRREA